MTLPPFGSDLVPSFPKVPILTPVLRPPLTHGTWHFLRAPSQTFSSHLPTYLVSCLPSQDFTSLLDISVNSSCFLDSSTWMFHCPESSSLKQNSAPLLPHPPKLLPPQASWMHHQPHFVPSHILPEHLPPPLISNKSCGPILSLIALGPSSPAPHLLSSVHSSSPFLTPSNPCNLFSRHFDF